MPCAVSRAGPPPLAVGVGTIGSTSAGNRWFDAESVADAADLPMPADVVELGFREGVTVEQG